MAFFPQDYSSSITRLHVVKIHKVLVGHFELANVHNKYDLM